MKENPAMPTASRIATLLCTLALLSACADRILVPEQELSSAASTAPGAASAPCSGCQYFSGSVSAGGSQTQPSSGWYESSTSGTHEGWLRGPAGTDFELRLDRWDGSRWREVAKVNKKGSEEYLS
jgi:hypothetical protein